MTATKVMDIIAKYKDCEGQASDTVSVYTERCSKIAENSEVRMSRRMDTSSKTQMTESMIQYGRYSCSSWTETVWSSFCRTIVRTILSRSFVQTWMGKNTELTMSICSLETRIILVGVRWRHQNVKKEVEYSVHMEKLINNLDLQESTSFFDHVYLWCSRRECNLIENQFWRIHKDVRITYFCWDNRKIT